MKTHSTMGENSESESYSKTDYLSRNSVD